MRVDVEAQAERTLRGIPVRLSSDWPPSARPEQPTVDVRVRGAASRLGVLARDSVPVVVRLVRHPARPGAPTGAGTERTRRDRDPRQRHARPPESRWLSGSSASRPRATRPPPPSLRTDGRRASSRASSILSQDVHRIFGGVVPELASRAHVARDRLGRGPRARRGGHRAARSSTAIAVTAGPGLVGRAAGRRDVRQGAGVHAATAAHRREPPRGASVRPDARGPPTLAPPFVGPAGERRAIRCCSTCRPGASTACSAQTRDDAAGEAFDKVAKLLGLGYPGRRADRAARREGRPGALPFPRPMLQELDRDGPHRYDFSFSGLKTAVLRAVRAGPSADLALAERRPTSPRIPGRRASTCSSRRRRTRSPRSATRRHDRRRRRLQPRARGARPQRLAGRARVSVASPRLNTDNAAMIAAAGAWRLARGERSGWDLEPRDDLPLPGLGRRSPLPDPTS